MLEYWNIGLKCEQKFLYLYTATLITTKDVIPAPYPVVGSHRQVRGKLRQESRKTLLPAGRQGIPGFVVSSAERSSPE